MTKLEWLGKAHGFQVTCVLLSAVATALLLHHNISEGSWVGFVQWVWSAQILGGIGHGVSDALSKPST